MNFYTVTTTLTRILLFLLICPALFAQDSRHATDETVDFVNQVVQKMSKIDGYWPVADSLEDFELKLIKLWLANDTLQNKRGQINTQIKGSLPKYILLTAEEKKHVDLEIASMQRKIWTDAPIKGVKILNADTAAVWRKRSTEFKQTRSAYFSFSKPIFIRNNTVCLFYSGHICGPLCSTGFLIAYTKVGDEWVEWFLIDSWVT